MFRTLAAVEIQVVEERRHCIVREVIDRELTSFILAASLEERQEAIRRSISLRTLLRIHLHLERKINLAIRIIFIVIRGIPKVARGRRRQD